MNSFEIAREHNNIIEVIERCGYPLKKVGTSWRHGDNNYLAVWEKTRSWYDFRERQGGDVVDFVAIHKYNGDKRQALLELVPAQFREKISESLKAEQRAQEYIKECEERLQDTTRELPAKTREYLRTRKISEQTIKECRIGFDLNSGRITIPFLAENGQKVLYYTRRAIAPDEKQRYLAAERDAFLAPCAWGLHTLNRGNSELFLTEGIFDGITLAQEGYSVLANGGGLNKAEKLVKYAYRFERAILAFDNDETGRSYTLDAAKELFKRRIAFEVVELPQGVKDISEYYTNGGNLQELFENTTAGLEYLALSYVPKGILTKNQERTLKNEMKRFITEAIRGGADEADVAELSNILEAHGFKKNILDAVIKKANKGETVEEMTAKILEQHELLFNEKTGFYEYEENSGVWQPRTDTAIRSYAKEYLGKISTPKKHAEILAEAKAAVNSNVPVEKFNKQQILVFRNGTFDVNTGKLREHSETDYSTILLGYEYDPEATCERWLQFIQEVTNGDSERAAVLQEFAGYILVPDCRFGKMLFLKGEGNNGKNVFCETLRDVFSKDNCSAVPAYKFGENFQMINLRDSVLNISSETSKALNKSRDNLFKVATGDDLHDSYKGRDVITFTSRAKLILCMNDYPEINDNTYALERRLLFVDFPIKFVKHPRGEFEKTMDTRLAARLKKELPGIFNWCYEGAKRLIKNEGFTENADTPRNVQQLKTLNNELYSFVDECIEKFFGQKVERVRVYGAYSNWCANNHIIPRSNRKFYVELNKILREQDVLFAEETLHGGRHIYNFELQPAKDE